MDVTHTSLASENLFDIGSLHLICGKIASGKSTLAQRLASSPRTVLISEDYWLAQLYPGEIRSIADYAKLSGRVRQAMEAHIVSLLAAGTSVVLDFPSNTLQTRSWARGIFERAGAPHYLHFINLPDERCKQQLQHRNRSGEHPFQTTDEQFDEITKHFVEPSSAEGFNLVIHD